VSIKINHQPTFDIDRVIKIYQKKDGVPIKYVCSTSLNTEGAMAADVFYRETPHPEFGNRYFGLYFSGGLEYITNADKVEELEFDVVQVGNKGFYSRHRHDFVQTGPVAIDGGRAYLRLIGNNLSDYPIRKYKVKDGQFKEII